MKLKLSPEQQTKLEAARIYAAMVQARWLKEGRINPIVNRGRPPEEKEERNLCAVPAANDHAMSR